MQEDLSGTEETALSVVIDNLVEQLKVLNIETDMPDQLTLSIDPLKYLGKLPEFYGDYRELQNFLDLVERIHPLLIKYDDSSQRIFSDIIRSKLKGRAREVIEINNHVTSWKDIKDVLRNNFGDRMTASQLFDELRGLIFKTNATEFYNEMKTILRRLNIKTKLEYQDNAESLERNLKANISSALNIFKSKMPEPMKSILYCRNPSDLEEAIHILHEAGYAFLTANGSGRSHPENIYNNTKGRMNKGRNNGRHQDRNSFNFNSLITNPHQNSRPSFNFTSQVMNPYRSYGSIPPQNSRNYFPTTTYNNGTVNRDFNSPHGNTNSGYRNSPFNHNNSSHNNYRPNYNSNSSHNNNSRYPPHIIPNNNHQQTASTSRNRNNNNDNVEPMDVDINNQTAVEVGNFLHQATTDYPT